MFVSFQSSDPNAFPANGNFPRFSSNPFASSSSPPLPPPSTSRGEAEAEVSAGQPLPASKRKPQQQRNGERDSPDLSKPDDNVDVEDLDDDKKEEVEVDEAKDSGPRFSHEPWKWQLKSDDRKEDSQDSHVKDRAEANKSPLSLNRSMAASTESLVA